MRGSRRLSCERYFYLSMGKFLKIARFTNNQTRRHPYKSAVSAARGGTYGDTRSDVDKNATGELDTAFERVGALLHEMGT